MDAVYELKTFTDEKTDLDSLVGLSVFAGSLKAGYEAHGLTAPQWLKERIETLSRCIREVHRDQLSAAIVRAKARAEANKSRADRLRDAQDEIDRLSKQLAALEG